MDSYKTRLLIIVAQQLKKNYVIYICHSIVFGNLGLYSRIKLRPRDVLGMLLRFNIRNSWIKWSPKVSFKTKFIKLIHVNAKQKYISLYLYY